MTMESKPRDFDPVLCQRETSFEAGYNDGREGRNMNSTYAYNCREDLRKNAFDGYHEGFDKGHTEFEKMVEANRKQMAEQQRESQRSVAIVVGRQGLSKWFCTIQPFTKKYEGSGWTEHEARHNTSAACLLENNEMFCSDRMSCESESIP